MKAHIHQLMALLWAGTFPLAGCQQKPEVATICSRIADPSYGFLKHTQTGPLYMEVQYRPVDCLLFREFGNNLHQDPQFIQRRRELEGAQYYLLKLSVRGIPGVDITRYRAPSPDLRQQRLYYLSYGMQQDILLVDGRDTLSPVLYHFERSYDLSPHRNFMLAFDRSGGEMEKDKKLILNAPFLDGPAEVHFRGADIGNLF